MNKVFIVGSNAFFSELSPIDIGDKHPSHYTQGDNNRVILEDNPRGYVHYQEIKYSGYTDYRWARVPKSTFIAYAKRNIAPAGEFGKFLVPEFVEEIGFTLDDLKDLYPVFKSKLKDRSEYLETIYNFYVENGDFTLTEDQRLEAYKVYLKARELPENEQSN